MTKLLTALKADPTNPVRVNAVRKYVAKHPMALCFLTDEERLLLALHGIA